MAEVITRFFASIVYQINMGLATLSILSIAIGMIAPLNVYFNPIFSSMAYTGLVLYWRFWYVFAIPSYYLGMISDAPRGRQLRTAAVVIVVLLLKFVLGFQLPG